VCSTELKDRLLLLLSEHLRVHSHPDRKLVERFEVYDVVVPEDDAALFKFGVSVGGLLSWGVCRGATLFSL
jgi:hypothetical protein